MKECNMTKDWSVTLFGETIPRWMHYGRIASVVYQYDYFTRRLWLRDETRNIWVSADPGRNGKIVSLVKNYVAHNPIPAECPGHIETCKYVREERARKYRAEKSKAHREERARREVLRICGAPSENISRPITACGAAKHTFTKQGGRVESDRIWGNPVAVVKGDKTEIVYIDPKAPNPIPAEFRDPGYAQHFEMGQTTSGAAGKYTRSGFETRDGLKVCQNKIRPEKKAVKREKLIIRINGKAVYSE